MVPRPPPRFLPTPSPAAPRSGAAATTRHCRPALLIRRSGWAPKDGCRYQSQDVRALHSTENHCRGPGPVATHFNSERKCLLTNVLFLVTQNICGSHVVHTYELPTRIAWERRAPQECSHRQALGTTCEYLRTDLGHHVSLVRSDTDRLGNTGLILVFIQAVRAEGCTCGE